MFSFSKVTIILTFTASCFGAPTGTSFQQTNGLDAQKLNAQFATMKISDTCTDGQQACVQGSFAQCVGTKWEVTPCAAGTTCVALPLVNKPGTSLACDTQSDAIARMQAAGVDASLTGNGTSSDASASVVSATFSITDSAVGTIVPSTSAVAASSQPSASSVDGDSNVPCPMMTTSVSTPEASPVTAPSSSLSSQVISTATSTPSPSGNDDSGSGCEDDGSDANEDFKLALVAVPASTSSSPQITGYTRGGLNRLVASVSESSSLVSPTSSLSSASSVVTSTPSTSADEDGVGATVTLLTTMFITVTPSSAAQATSVPANPIDSVLSGILSSSSLADSSSASLPTDSLSLSITQSTIVTFISSTSVVSATASESVPTNVATPTTVFLNRPANSVSTGIPTPSSPSAVASSSSSIIVNAGSSSAAVVSVSSAISSPSTTITSAPAASETPLNSAQLASMLTASFVA